MASYLPLIILLPLIGFLINGLFGKSMPRLLVGLIGCSSVLLSFIMTVLLFIQLSQDATPIEFQAYNWIDLQEIKLNVGFLADRLSVWMMMIITGVGFLIHLYSTGYMHDDPGYSRYFAYLNLFVFFMLILVMGNSFLLLFVGWEGVGLCSYLLIGFWYKNIRFGYAARKAFIMNRIGDLGFMLGLFLIWQHAGSLEFSKVFSSITTMDNSTLTITGLLLFIGATGKSAQIPLFTWLPDAMAGPTPVSALIHAATMVTAGIYMIVRSNAIFLHAETLSQVITVVAIATSLIAAVIALQQNDIKKVLAYSTVSQLGLMFVALGVGAYSAAIFHLTTHAFFKALLFLGSGSVIHAMEGEQDIRQMGGLKKYLPATHITFLIGTLAIIGFPFLAGFFSKDEILAASFAHATSVWVFGLLISILTALYMLRLYFLTFYGEFRGTTEKEHHLHESPRTMTIPLWVLAVLSAIGGLLNVPHLFGGNQFLSHWLEPVLNGSVHELDLSAATEWTLMGVTTLIILGILFWSYNYYVKRKKLALTDEQLSGWRLAASNKLYIDEIYDNTVVSPFIFSAKVADDYVEKGLINRLAEGIGSFFKSLADTLRRTQDGNLEIYLLGMVAGIILLLLFNYLI